MTVTDERREMTMPTAAVRAAAVRVAAICESRSRPSGDSERSTSRARQAVNTFANDG